MKKKNISVFGMGYVGLVTAVCLAKEGHTVIGVDINQEKIDLINEGQSPIIENGLDSLLTQVVKTRRLSCTSNTKKAVDCTEIGIICVGTPSNLNGSLNLQYVEKVTQEIGDALKSRSTFFLAIYRSTMIPGTMRSFVIPNLEKFSCKPVGETFDVLFCPEFLREGSSIFDFYHPSKVVIGERTGGQASEILVALLSKYNKVSTTRCPFEVAEAVKYCDNLFHALKITFANEIGQFCKSFNIDSQFVMDILCRDRKLNISTQYLRPGFAFGGSCLPKDTRAFLAEAQQRNVTIPLIGSLLHSNECQVVRALNIILALGKNNIGFYGLAFKSGTDDLRESPYVEIAQQMLAKGAKVAIFDPYIRLGKLTGQNRSYIEQKFPHIDKCLVAQAEDLAQSDLIVICHKARRGWIGSLLNSQKSVFDLTGANYFPIDPLYISIV